MRVRLLILNPSSILSVKVLRMVDIQAVSIVIISASAVATAIYYGLHI
jgi:hypothetical protein